MTRTRMPIAGLAILMLATPNVLAQSPSNPPPAAQPSAATEARIEAMSKLLLETQHQLEQTQLQLNQLRSELDALRGHAVAAEPAAPQASSTSLAEQVTRQQEQQEILEAEVKQHDQTKLESVSKYPVRIYGLMLFNAYSNAGVVDNPDLPSVATPPTPDTSHGSVGATFRQTLFGISATGPTLFGARSSADVSIDFFGGPSYSYYGSPNGAVRLRRGNIELAWGKTSDPETSRDELRLGIDAPLISPLSPTSYATVAEPALSWSGNLWTWAPEIQYKHTVDFSAFGSPRTLQLEGGLWDPPVVETTGASANRISSAGELSRRPGLLGRASLHSGPAEHPFSFGVGGFSDRQTYYENQQIRMWAVTGDWQIPLTRRFQLDGEIYRGRGLGGLGGGVYKDVLTGIDRTTGASRTIGLNAVGGWMQLKTHLFQGSEVNLIYGQDDGFSSDFRQLSLGGSTYQLEQSARNHSLVSNFIYRPKTYLILSPEYRRIMSWRNYGSAATANIFTLSLGYQF